MTVAANLPPPISSSGYATGRYRRIDRSFSQYTVCMPIDHSVSCLLVYLALPVTLSDDNYRCWGLWRNQCTDDVIMMRLNVKQKKTFAEDIRQMFRALFYVWPIRKTHKQNSYAKAFAKQCFCVAKFSALYAYVVDVK